MLGSVIRQCSRRSAAVARASASAAAPSLSKRFFSDSTDVDVKLQEEFNNGWNRAKETWGMLAKTERDNFNQMLEEGVLRPSMLEAVLCYVDLKNPLLRKYNFDYKEFIEGAKQACFVVDQTLFSQDFADYATGKASESENATFLQELLHPPLFNEVKNVFKAYDITPEQLNTERSIPRLSLTRVATRVVQPGEAQVQSHVNEALAKEDLEKFPTGSVIASVFVDLEMLWENRETQNSWVRHQALVFDGCISDHVPCDWTIRQLMSTIPIPRPMISS